MLQVRALAAFQRPSLACNPASHSSRCTDPFGPHCRASGGSQRHSVLNCARSRSLLSYVLLDFLVDGIPDATLRRFAEGCQSIRHEIAAGLSLVSLALRGAGTLLPGSEGIAVRVRWMATFAPSGRWGKCDQRHAWPGAAPRPHGRRVRHGDGPRADRGGPCRQNAS